MNDLPIRYCPACGHIGAVLHNTESCCPEDDSARYVPQSVALYEQVQLRHMARLQLEAIECK